MEIRDGRRVAQTAQKTGDLSAVVRAVIDYVLDYLPKRCLHGLPLVSV